MSNLGFPIPALGSRCILIDDFLGAAECQDLIALSEGRGYADAGSDYPPSYRNNHRHVIDSDALAARLDARLRPHLGKRAPDSVTIDDKPWHYDGINARFRFCRYQAGQRFNVHQDGVHHRGPACRSHLTFLVYLTDGTAFEGGDTVFHAQGPGAEDAEGQLRELGRVRPRAGSLLLFEHDLWHAGDEITAGTKHVLRSDVLYRAAGDATGAAAPDPSAHQGYVWTLAALEGGHSASGGRDATIRIRDAAGQPVRYLNGHAQSVLGLAPLPGQGLASISRDRSLRIWNWASGVCETTVAAHDSAVLDVLALPDGRLATAGADGLIKLWRQDGGAAGSLAGHAGWVWQLAWVGDGRIASASEDGSVRIWDLATSCCSAELEGEQPLRTLLVLEGAIWTGDIAGRVACWTCVGGRWTRSAEFKAHGAAIRRLRRLGTGLLASCGEDCALRVWDTVAGTQAPALRFEARHANFVTDVLRQGDALLSSSYDGRILRHEDCFVDAPA